MLGPATRIQACLRSTVNPDYVAVYDLQRGFDCLGKDHRSLHDYPPLRTDKPPTRTNQTRRVSSVASQRRWPSPSGPAEPPRAVGAPRRSAVAKLGCTRQTFRERGERSGRTGRSPRRLSCKVPVTPIAASVPDWRVPMCRSPSDRLESANSEPEEESEWKG